MVAHVTTLVKATHAHVPAATLVQTAIQVGHTPKKYRPHQLIVTVEISVLRNGQIMQ